MEKLYSRFFIKNTMPGAGALGIPASPSSSPSKILMKVTELYG
jgi:hypothetical protein